MADQKKTKHIDRRTLIVRVVAIVCAVLIAGSSIVAAIFFH